MSNFRLYGFLFFVALLLLISCKKAENFTSRITFFNGVLNAPSNSTLSLRVDSVIIAQSIGYDSLKVNTNTPSGTFAINLFGNGQSLYTFTTNLQANEAYTTVVYDSAQKFRFFMRRDVFPTTPGAGRCAIRIYNLIPGSSNLFLGSFKGVTANNKDTVRAFLTGQTFNDFATSTTSTTSPAFTEIDTITKPGIYTADTSRLTGLQTLLPGKIYTFFLTGSIIDSNKLHPKCIVQVHN